MKAFHKRYTRYNLQGSSTPFTKDGGDWDITKERGGGGGKLYPK
jgi:hypothetical protein